MQDNQLSKSLLILFLVKLWAFLRGFLAYFATIMEDNVISDLEDEGDSPEPWRLEKSPLENSIALRTIFSNLPVEDLKNVRQVCQQWNEEAVGILAARTCVRISNLKQGVKRCTDYFNFEAERRRDSMVFLNFTNYELDLRLREQQPYNTLDRSSLPKPATFLDHLDLQELLIFRKTQSDLAEFMNGPWRDKITSISVKGLSGYEWHYIFLDFCRCLFNLKTLEIRTKTLPRITHWSDKNAAEFKTKLDLPKIGEDKSKSKLEVLRVMGCVLDWKFLEELQAPLKEVYLQVKSLWDSSNLRKLQQYTRDIKKFTLNIWSNETWDFSDKQDGDWLDLDLPHIPDIYNYINSQPLEDLSIGCNAPMEFLETLLEGIHKCPRKLNVVVKSPRASSGITSAYSQKILSMFSGPKYEKLEELHLCIKVDSRLTKLRTDSEPERLIIFDDTPNPNLKVLKLSMINNPISFKFSCFISRLYKNIPNFFPNIVSLSVDIRNGLFVEPLLKSIKVLERLEFLQINFFISNCDRIPANLLFGPSIFSKSSSYQGLLNLKGLKTLRLIASNFDWVQFFPDSRICIFQELSKMENLVRLEVTKNMVSDVNAAALLDLKQRLSSFTIVTPKSVSFCKHCSPEARAGPNNY